MILLANSPVAHYTDITGTKQIDSFVYANLLIHQPIITKLIEQLNKNKRKGEYANKNNAMHFINNEIHSNIIPLLQALIS